MVVDPRYTPYCRAGRHLLPHPQRHGYRVLYGGLYKYIIDNLIEPGLAEYTRTGKNPDNYNFEYLINYTNASYILMEEFDFDPETGLFSGWDAEKETYDAHSWHYETDHEEPWDTSESGTYAWSVKPGVPAFDKPVLTVPKKDATLQHERCVYQKFKEHYPATTWIPFAVFAAWTREDLELVYSLGLPLVLLARRAPFCMHWVSPAYVWRSEYSFYVGSPAALWQYWCSWRRRLRIARRAQRSGCNRHGHAGKRAACILEVVEHYRPRHLGSLAFQPDLFRWLLHE